MLARATGETSPDANEFIDTSPDLRDRRLGMSAFTDIVLTNRAQVGARPAMQGAVLHPRQGLDD